MKRGVLLKNVYLPHPSETSNGLNMSLAKCDILFYYDESTSWLIGKIVFLNNSKIL